MKWIYVAISVFGIFLFQACDQKKDQYEGLSDLVAERQEVRKTIAEETTRKKELGKAAGTDAPKSSPVKEEVFSTSIVYEKPVEILDSESGMPLAKGVAYMNEAGQIVKIKVFRD